MGCVDRGYLGKEDIRSSPSPCATGPSLAHPATGTASLAPNRALELAWPLASRGGRPLSNTSSLGRPAPAQVTSRKEPSSGISPIGSPRGRQCPAGIKRGAANGRYRCLQPEANLTYTANSDCVQALRGFAARMRIDRNGRANTLRTYNAHDGQSCACEGHDPYAQIATVQMTRIHTPHTPKSSADIPRSARLRGISSQPAPRAAQGLIGPRRASVRATCPGLRALPQPRARIKCGRTLHARLTVGTTREGTDTVAGYSLRRNTPGLVPEKRSAENAGRERQNALGTLLGCDLLQADSAFGQWCVLLPTRPSVACTAYLLKTPVPAI